MAQCPTPAPRKKPVTPVPAPRRRTPNNEESEKGALDAFSSSSQELPESPPAVELRRNTASQSSAEHLSDDDTINETISPPPSFPPPPLPRFDTDEITRKSYAASAQIGTVNNLILPIRVSDSSSSGSEDGLVPSIIVTETSRETTPHSSSPVAETNYENVTEADVRRNLHRRHGSESEATYMNFNKNHSDLDKRRSSPLVCTRRNNSTSSTTPEVLYFNASSSSPSAPQGSGMDEASVVSYENVTLRNPSASELSPQSSRKPSQSILLCFDPVLQNQFLEEEEEDDTKTDALSSLAGLRLSKLPPQHPCGESAIPKLEPPPQTKRLLLKQSSFPPPTTTVQEEEEEEEIPAIPPKPQMGENGISWITNSEYKTLSMLASGFEDFGKGSDSKSLVSNSSLENSMETQLRSKNKNEESVMRKKAKSEIPKPRVSHLYDTPEGVEGAEGGAPAPPVRMDSIPREDPSKLPTPIHMDVLEPLPSLPPTTVPAFQKEPKRSSLMNINALKSAAWGFLNKNTPGTVHAFRHFSRPPFGPENQGVTFSGVLTQPGRDRTEWRVNLAQGTLTWTSDKGQQELPISQLTSVGILNTQQMGSAPGSLPAYCVEISSSSEKMLHTSQVFLVPSVAHRAEWMQHLAWATTNTFARDLLAGYNIIGWLHIKEGVSGMWVPCWVLLRGRKLHYSVQSGVVLIADLRKARYISTQNTGGLLETFGCLLIELQGRSLYFQGLNERDTQRWGRKIQAAALKNGTMLYEQQLTKDDVPVLVDKCINFIAREGMSSEGVYRHSGQQSVVSRLLMDFAKDAWAVQVTRAQYTEHDVASALKRFFKDMPEPFFPNDVIPLLFKLALSKDKSGDEKAPRYHRLLKKLHPIYFVTARKLFGHLYFLQLESRKNLMTASNLAAIWGVTLMRQQPLGTIGEGQTQATEDLISLYPLIFNVSEAELNLEMKMIVYLEKLHAVAPAQQPHTKPSGDLKIWVTVESGKTSDQVQISVSPQKSAAEVCAELDRGPNFTLQEHVLGGALRRPLHASEKIFDVVVRWGYWDEEDRKNNQIVYSVCQLYLDILPLAVPPLAICSEVKYADDRTKHFRSCVFQLSQATLSYYKDRKLSTKHSGEWKVEDIVWYVGYEPKRMAPTEWCITFIPRHNKPNRTKERPFFGHTFCSLDHDQVLRWCAALLLAEHPQGL